MLCMGQEARLADCHARMPRGSNNCQHTEDVAVTVRARTASPLQAAGDPSKQSA